MATKRQRTLYEDLLIECVAAAINTLARMSGKPFGFWTAALIGQAAAALKQQRRGAGKMPTQQATSQQAGKMPTQQEGSLALIREQVRAVLSRTEID